ncbi:MAG: hypothetical protein WC443_10015 [Desulfobaccales bacterium]
MRVKIRLIWMAVMASLLISLVIGCASSSGPIQQPPTTSHMRSTVGTPDEICPLVPGEARNVRKVGNQWICDLNGQTMIYNDATQRWEPKQK